MIIARASRTDDASAEQRRTGHVEPRIRRGARCGETVYIIADRGL
jgi:hypothetical protein